jgi:hypothetical protein
MKSLNRKIMSDAKELKLNNTNIKVYIKEYVKENKSIWHCQIFTGRKIKPTIFRRYTTIRAVEAEILEQINLDIANTEYQKSLKKLRRENTEKLKASLVPDATVRTGFTYNMTFNKFYKVVSNKGNTYKFEILETEWVDGNKGWTGNVRAGAATGMFIEGKITTSGLKIDGLSGYVISPSDTFYENHLD